MEVSVGVLDYKGETIVLGITEIVPEKEFFDYEAKYEGASQEITPARLDDENREKVENLDQQLQSVEKKNEEILRLHKQQVEQLEVIANLSAEQAKEQLIESLKAEARTSAMSYVNEIMEEARMSANKEAKKIVVQTIQRTATEHVVENSVSVFHIENDEIKGRIIGREGRNIRALEAATGIEIIVDDTPEAIILSVFDPIRREVARLALHQLVTDGRIHPGVS